MYTVIWVTAFYDFGEETRNRERPCADRIAQFQCIASTGIPILLFTSSSQASMHLFPKNVTVIILELHETDTFRELVKGNPVLPSQRNEGKDTIPFLVLMNAKTEFVARATALQPSPYYAWIDFNVAHVFPNQREEVCHLLTHLSRATFTIEDRALIPGCWDRQPDVSLDCIHWRFCGGFFLGNKVAVCELHERAQRIRTELPMLTWEVNVWAYLENTENWECCWYLADHNASLFNIPNTFLA